MLPVQRLLPTSIVAAPQPVEHCLGRRRRHFGSPGERRRFDPGLSLQFHAAGRLLFLLDLHYEIRDGASLGQHHLVRHACGNVDHVAGFDVLP